MIKHIVTAIEVKAVNTLLSQETLLTCLIASTLKANAP